jgi:hypothetical protein
MAVVVIDKHDRGPFQMPRVQDEQTLGADGSNEPFRDPIRLRRLNRCSNDPAALRLKFASKLWVNLRS